MSATMAQMSVRCVVSIIRMVRYICCVLVYLWHSLQLKRPSLAPNQRLADAVSSSARPWLPTCPPFNMLHHQFYYIFLTSYEQLLTPARKVYDRDPVVEYTSIQTTAHTSHYYTRNQIAERGEHHLFLEQPVVSTVVVLILLTYLQLQPFGA